MFKYIALCLCVSLSIVVCGVLHLEEGADCEWDGVKGTCVKETRCFTTLDRRGEKQPVCSTKGEVTVICCTDCELVNDTRNVVLSPTSGFYWKDGTKARDSCLDYLRELPYRCRDGGFYSGVSRSYDEERKCHSIGLWGIGGAPPPGHIPGAKYPHQALLGYGEDLQSAQWLAGGSIISTKYILTAALTHFLTNGEVGLPPKFVALGVKKLSDPPSTWQTHSVKRFIPHPDYKANSLYNDIALIETETMITFNKNVLPACLHVKAANDETAIATTWKDLTASQDNEMADTLQTINLEKYSEEECKTAYSSVAASFERPLVKSLSFIHWEEIDYERQICYGSKSHAPEAKKGLFGEPLLVDTQFSRCIFTIIGVTIHSGGANKASLPNRYTKVAHYKPWIESVVWA